MACCTTFLYAKKIPQFFVRLCAAFMILSIFNDIKLMAKTVYQSSELCCGTDYVSLVFDVHNGFLCSGLLVGNEWILTSADCVYYKVCCFTLIG